MRAFKQAAALWLLRCRVLTEKEKNSQINHLVTPSFPMMRHMRRRKYDPWSVERSSIHEPASLGSYQLGKLYSVLGLGELTPGELGDRGFQVLWLRSDPKSTSLTWSG